VRVSKVIYIPRCVGSWGPIITLRRFAGFLENCSSQKQSTPVYARLAVRVTPARRFGGTARKGLDTGKTTGYIAALGNGTPIRRS
jgi:hypothetical protein